MQIMAAEVGGWGGGSTEGNFMETSQHNNGHNTLIVSHVPLCWFLGALFWLHLGFNYFIYIILISYIVINALWLLSKKSAPITSSWIPHFAVTWLFMLALRDSERSGGESKQETYDTSSNNHLRKSEEFLMPTRRCLALWSCLPEPTCKMMR